MRVVHLIDSLADHGATRSLVEVAPFLLERGLQYEVAFLRDPDDLGGNLDSAGVRIHDLRGPDNRSAHTSRAMKLFSALEPTIVHTTLSRADVAGRSAANSLGMPVVTTWASTCTAPGNVIKQVKRRRTDAIDRWTAQYASRFHAVSEMVAESVGNRLGVAQSRIDVIPRGRDAHRLGDHSPKRTGSCRDRLGLGDGPVVVAFADHVHRDGLDVLLDAAAAVHATLPGLTVLIGGDHGLETDHLTDMISQRGLERVVRLLGPRSDVGALLAAADVCAVPSRTEEFPDTVVEAMLVGTPVIASNLASVRVVLPNERMGRLVRPEDPLDLARALEQTLTNPTSRHDRAVLARKNAVRKFSLPAVADETIAFYERSLRTVPVGAS